MKTVNNEEKIQRALGTLPTYRVCIYGPKGGLLIRYIIVEALTPQHAIYEAWTCCSYSIRERFLKLLQNTYKQQDHRIHRFMSAKVELMGAVLYDVINSYKFHNLCQILTVDGKLRNDIPEDILKDNVNN